MSQIQEINRSAIKLVLLALALGLVLAVGLAFGGGLRISRPLRQMIDAAARMARGDFSQRLATSSSDEVGDLARSLNHMGERLQDLLAEATSGTQRLQAVLEGMMEGVLVVDVQRRLLVVNPSYRVMFDLDGDVIGQQLTEVTRSALLRDAFDRCMEQRQHVNEEVHLYGPPDRVLDAHVVPLIANGSVHGAVAVLHDITRLKQLEQVRRDFVANVSHELRTPLSAIKGYAETLLGGAGITEETRAEFLEVIERHADRMSRLVSDLLELARIEANPEAMTLEILDLRPVVDRVLNGLGSVFGERELELQVDFADHLPPVWADEGSIEQILNNLLDNAIKYTEPGGHIHLAAERRNRHLRVTVADTGIGIAAQHLKRIFERFYRVDKARSRELGGTGLGLSIVKHLVQLHGGRVWAESEPGKGTQITFELRIAG